MSYRISIIITNYNYADYIGKAIESALAVRCENKEIIVCDDGSTDHSREVIARYADRLDHVILKQNAGQPSAANAAFAISTGDIVFFLDSDDMYLPEIAERVLEKWHPGVSKVQFAMLNCERDGTLTGTMFPNFPDKLTPQAIRASLIKTALYPTPPTTGNAFARSFLQKVFPVPESREIEGFDSYLNTVAPLEGDVETIIDPLAIYRTHGANSWGATVLKPERLVFYITQDILRTRYLQREAKKHGLDIGVENLYRNASHMMFRLGAYKIARPIYPVPEDSWPPIIWHYIDATWRTKSSLKVKVVAAGWCIAVALSPYKPLTYWLLSMRFVAVRRSRAMVRFMRMIGAVKKPKLPPNTATSFL